MLWILFACQTPPEDTGGLAFQDPSTEGPHAVATRLVNFNTDAGLNIPLQVWHPTTSTATARHRYNDLIEGTALDGGGVDCSENRPVVLFSHGNTGMRFQSFFLTEYLASHGFIVLAPDHVGNTIFDNDESRKPELILRRPQDLSNSFNWLLEQPDFQSCVDESAGFAVIGHSFGGYTALAISGAYLDTDITLAHCDTNGGWLCEHVETIAENDGVGIYDYTDERVWASVPMTPAALETLLGGIDTVTVPTLIMAGALDDLTPYDSVVKPIYERLTQEDKSLLTIEEAGHYTFSNACDLVSTYPDCGEGFMPPVEAHQLINTATTAFLQTVRGMEGMEAYQQLENTALRWE